LVEKWKRKLRE